MFIDAGDFYIKLDKFNKKIKNAQQVLVDISSNLGGAMKEPEPKRLKMVTKIGSSVSQTYRELRKQYAELRGEYARIEKQMLEVSSRVMASKRELREKDDDDLEILKKTVETYEGAIFAYTLFYPEIYGKMSSTLQDFSEVIGQVEAIADIINGFSDSSDKGVKEVDGLQELQQSISKTDRYIW